MTRRLPFFMVAIISCNMTTAFTSQHRSITRSHTSVPTSEQYRTLTQLYSTRTKETKSTSVTSSLISNLAVLALKLRLADQTGVECNVSSSSSDILKGIVGPVTVKGKGWRSPLGLSCRLIEAKVETCNIDFSSVVKRRKLILVDPAVGQALVALSQDDFGNFLTHPLLQGQVPSISSRKDEKILMLRDHVKIDTDKNHVVFYAEYLSHRWRLQLEREDKGAVIKATLDRSVSAAPTLSEDHIDSIEKGMSETLSIFFNELVFELDGTYLSFKDMKIHDRKSADPVVMFCLEILVKKFPSPGLAF